MDKIPITCPHCTNKDQSMIEVTVYRKGTTIPKVFLCSVCGKTWEIDLRESLSSEFITLEPEIGRMTGKDNLPKK